MIEENLKQFGQLTLC